MTHNNDKSSIISILLGISIAGLGNSAIAQDQDFNQVEIETLPVAENIYMLIGEGGDIGVSTGEDGVFTHRRSVCPLNGENRGSGG